MLQVALPAIITLIALQVASHTNRKAHPLSTNITKAVWSREMTVDGNEECVQLLIAIC